MISDKRSENILAGCVAIKAWMRDCRFLFALNGLVDFVLVARLKEFSGD